MYVLVQTIRNGLAFVYTLKMLGEDRKESTLDGRKTTLRENCFNKIFKD
jgi:hypothetical protein